MEITGKMRNDTNAITHTFNDLNKVNKTLPYLTMYLMRQMQKITQELGLLCVHVMPAPVMSQ